MIPMPMTQRVGKVIAESQLLQQLLGRIRCVSLRGARWERHFPPKLDDRRENSGDNPYQSRYLRVTTGPISRAGHRHWHPAQESPTTGTIDRRRQSAPR